MFKGSENVGSGEHFFLVFNYGGSMNGTTNTDRTIYYEILPKNQLDLGLFLEADRMRVARHHQGESGQPAQAVQEERRLRLDNQPYGKSQERFNEMAYDNFAYKHSVIGSMEDLNAATVDDVAAFFRTYYAPNNAVLALVGDLDTKATLAKVEKYLRQHSAAAGPKPVDLVRAGAEGRAARVDGRSAGARARRSTWATGFRRRRTPTGRRSRCSARSSAAAKARGCIRRLVKEKELCTGIGCRQRRADGAGALPGHVLGPRRQGHQGGGSGDHRRGDASCTTAPVTEQELQRVRTSARRSGRQHARERAEPGASAGRQRGALQRSEPDQHAVRRACRPSPRPTCSAWPGRTCARPTASSCTRCPAPPRRRRRRPRSRAEEERRT